MPSMLLGIRKSTRQKNLTVVHNISKCDSLNTDMEEEEKDAVWEIDRDWTKKYYRRNNIILKKRARDEIEEIANHRKELRCEGELLVIWKNGIRDWGLLSHVATDEPKMVDAYLKDNNLTMQMMQKQVIEANTDEIVGKYNLSCFIIN
jgi:hypothetical protein